MFRSRFLWKLYAGYVLLILLTIGVVGGLVASQSIRRTQDDIDTRLEAEAVLLRDIVTSIHGTELEARLQSRLRTLGEELKTRLTVIRADGQVLGDSVEKPELMENHGQRPEVLRALEAPQGTASRFSQTVGQRMRYLALRVDIDGQHWGWVRTSQPLTSVTARLEQLRDAAILGGAVTALVALVLGFLLARRVTRPVLSMAVAADAIAGGDYEKQVEIESDDELGNLAQAFNVMNRHLRTSMATINADRRKLTAILSSMVEGVIAADRDERVVHMNEAAGKMLRVDPDRALAQPIWETIRVREISEAISEAIRRDRVIHRVVRLPDSQDRILDLQASPLEAGEGVMAGVVLVLDDITQLRRLENMRRDFLGNVSHELKTPVTAIRALVETVLDDDEMDDAIRSRFLGKIRDQAERMSALVNDLLSLSRLESETDALEVEPIDARQPIESAILARSTSSADKGIEILAELGSEKIMVQGDAEALEQAAGNLIDNAIKYSQGETIHVRVLRSGGEVLIEVEDNGVGIEPRHQERIFERFYRVDKARSRELGGTGLGLAIVKHIALAHDGRVSLDSKIGEGSSFQIRIPAARSLHLDSQILGPSSTSTPVS